MSDLRAEPCVCGGLISAMPGQEAAAVFAHSRTSAHRKVLDKMEPPSIAVPEEPPEQPPESLEAAGFNRRERMGRR